MRLHYPACLLTAKDISAREKGRVNGIIPKLFTKDKTKQKNQWEVFELHSNFSAMYYRYYPRFFNHLLALQPCKSKHGKKYSTNEENKRLSNYLENMQLADERNAAESALVHGETIFSDLSPSEFQAKYLTASVQTPENGIHDRIAINGSRVISKLAEEPSLIKNIHPKRSTDPKLASPVDPTRLVDWSTGSTIYVTGVKNQVCETN